MRERKKDGRSKEIRLKSKCLYIAKKISRNSVAQNYECYEQAILVTQYLTFKFLFWRFLQKRKRSPCFDQTNKKVGKATAVIRFF